MRAGICAIHRLLLVALWLTVGVAGPSSCQPGLPTVADVEAAPGQSYVVGLFTPVFGGGAKPKYAVVVERTAPPNRGRRMRIPLVVGDIPPEWKSPCPGDEVMYRQTPVEGRGAGRWALIFSLDEPVDSAPASRYLQALHNPSDSGPKERHFAVLFSRLEPGPYKLVEYACKTECSVAETSMSFPLGKEFSVPAGAVVYVGSIGCREDPLFIVDATEWEYRGLEYDGYHRLVGPKGFKPTVRAQLLDNLPAVLALLEFVERGLGKTVEARVVKADFLATAGTSNELSRLLRDLAGQGVQVTPTPDGVRITLTPQAADNTTAQEGEHEGAQEGQQDRKQAAGDPPLHQAVRQGDANAVRELLAEGADVNGKDADGDVALFLARNKDIAELLLANGADVNAKNSFSRTPLHRAAEVGRREVAELLLAKGADVNAKDRVSQTPLHWAAVGASREVAELLLANGADVSAKNSFGRTPLHRAAEVGSREVVELLLVKGADVNSRDKEGKTPLAIAEEQKREAVAELLRTHGGTK